MALFYSDANKTLHKVAGNINLPTNVERVDVVYGKNSNDPNINWGYTSGLPSGTNVTGKDFNKYKYLRVYVRISFLTGFYYVDLTQTDVSRYDAGNVFNFGFESSATNYLFVGTCTVNGEKTSITVNSYIEWLNDGHTYAPADAYYTYKIEGIY